MKVTYEFTEPEESQERSIFENSHRYHRALVQLLSIVLDLRTDLLELGDVGRARPEFLAEQLESSYADAQDTVIDFVCGVVDLTENANVEDEGR